VIRATVLIETILAAFEMDEILYELRYRFTRASHIHTKRDRETFSYLAEVCGVRLSASLSVDVDAAENIPRA
jgi:malate synthase